jgi:hypothetical protein
VAWSVRYQAWSRDEPRRAAVKVEWLSGELYPQVGLHLTNMTRPVEQVLTFYQHSGTTQQWIKEGKNAATWARLSYSAFKASAGLLQLHSIGFLE